MLVAQVETDGLSQVLRDVFRGNLTFDRLHRPSLFTELSPARCGLSPTYHIVASYKSPWAAGPQLPAVHGETQRQPCRLDGTNAGRLFVHQDTEAFSSLLSTIGIGES